MMQVKPHILAQKISQFEGSLVLLNDKARIQYASPRLEYARGFSPAEAFLKNPGELWGGRMSKDFYADFWKRVPYRATTVCDVQNRHANGVLREETLQIIRIPYEKSMYYFEMQAPQGLQERFRARLRKFDAQTEISFMAFRSLLCEFLEMPKKDILSFEQVVDALVNHARDTFSDRITDMYICRSGISTEDKLRQYYERYHGIVLNYFRTRTSQEDAEDLTQEVFLKAWRHLDTFHPGASYKTYLLRIAHNRYVDWLRVHKYGAFMQSDLSEDLDLCTNSHAHLMNDLDSRLLLGALSQPERELLSKFYLEGYQLGEIARIWKMSENAIKLRISRLRKRLRAVNDGAGEYS